MSTCSMARGHEPLEAVDTTILPLLELARNWLEVSDILTVDCVGKWLEKYRTDTCF